MIIKVGSIVIGFYINCLKKKLNFHVIRYLIYDLGFHTSKLAYGRVEGLELG